MEEYKELFKEMFLSEFILFPKETNLDKEFIKHFDTDEFIEQFTKAFLRFSSKMEIDLNYQFPESYFSVGFGLAYYILKEIRQELMNEYDSLGYNDTVIQDRLSFQDEVEKHRFISNVKFFTNEMNFKLFGKTDDYYQKIFEAEQNRFIELWKEIEPEDEDETTNGYEYENYVFENVFSKYEYLMLIGAGKYKEAEKILKKNKELKENLSRKSKPGDVSYQRNMEFINRILNERITKYRVVKEYCNISGFNQQSLRNTLDKFLDSHKDEILKIFELNEDEFYKIFFPKKLYNQ